MNNYQKLDFIYNWQIKHSQQNYNPQKIFRNVKSIDLAYLSLSFYLTIASFEILFNQPFKKRIGILHNFFFNKILSLNIEKVNRIEINTFAYSLFLVLHKLFEIEKEFKFLNSKLLIYSISHWSSIKKFSEKKNMLVKEKFFKLWDEKEHLVKLSTKESKIDLIFDLYRAFELGISDKEIIKKNIANLSFSVSKSSKEFRFDALKYFKKTILIWNNSN